MASTMPFPPQLANPDQTLQRWMSDVFSFIVSGGAGGSGTVTNIATTLPLTGGPITTTGTLAINTFTGDAGAGGLAGTVPAPAAGDAAAGKFLKASGGWAVPAGGTANRNFAVWVGF